MKRKKLTTVAVTEEDLAWLKQRALDENTDVRKLVGKIIQDYRESIESGQEAMDWQAVKDLMVA